ncbi:MAG TPA: hypothetical protein G4N98_06250 [Thermoflexia bacterium]|nr:hypothetical protein [Thermoflexia bacterium]
MFHAADRVIVGVMTTPADFRIARDAGWYRIPQKHAPQSTSSAAVLAFYFTAPFKKNKWAIHWYAEVRGYELVQRRDLLPTQPHHPHADDPYYKIQLGPLIHREPPIPSLHWRRITFIETSWDRFNDAEEINDLYVSGAEGLYVTLKESGFFPEREYLIRDNDQSYTADLAIHCHRGTVAVMLDREDAPAGVLREADPDTVRAAIQRLGGALPPGER